MHLTWWPSKLAGTDWPCQFPWLTWNRRLDLTMTGSASNAAFSLMCVCPAQILLLHLICASTFKRGWLQLVSICFRSADGRYYSCRSAMLRGTNAQKQGTNLRHSTMCPKFGALAPPLPHVPCHASFWNWRKKGTQRCYKCTWTTALDWKVWMMSCLLAAVHCEQLIRNQFTHWHNALANATRQLRWVIIMTSHDSWTQSETYFKPGGIPGIMRQLLFCESNLKPEFCSKTTPLQSPLKFSGVL